MQPTMKQFEGTASNEMQSSRPFERMVVVGGSLVGLATAIRLAREKMSVTVLERSLRFSEGTGLGIDRHQLSALTGVSAFGGEGRLALPVVQAGRDSTRWMAVYRWLLGVAHEQPGIRILAGQTVTRVRSDPDSATATTGEASFEADLIVGADGRGSMARRFVAPDHTDARYAGYGIWRGMIDEAALTQDVRNAFSERPSSIWAGGRYRLVSYLIPGPDSGVVPGTRSINWAWYDPDMTAMFEAAGCVRADTVHRSLRPDGLSRSLTSRLKELAGQLWPAPLATAIQHSFASNLVFATPIAEYAPTRLTRGRVVLVGDAAHLAAPATGAGLLTGLADAEALGRVVRGHRNADAALNDYEAQRLGPARDLAHFSQEWSQAYLSQARPG